MAAERWLLFFFEMLLICSFISFFIDLKSISGKKSDTLLREKV